MTFSFFKSLGLLASVCALGACGTEPSGQDGSHRPDYDPTKDFIPGDPSFVRDTRLDVPNVSRRATQRSHNAGQNCLRCHQEKGPGFGKFTLAGTLYTPEGVPFPNATLKLYARAEAIEGEPPKLADEVAEIEVDGYGNFHTTDLLPNIPKVPLYPRFFGPSGEALVKPDGSGPAQMGGGVITGGCNFCHGNGFRVSAMLP